MENALRPVREKNLVWRDIAGEVVIAEGDNSTVRVLNGTASAIWNLADGTREAGDIAASICSRFDVEPEQARADVDEFFQELLQAGLIKYEDASQA